MKRQAHPTADGDGPAAQGRVEQLLDRGIEGIQVRMEDGGLAQQYARMDTYADLKPDSISILPLEKADSFKTVLPIQAADFMAWELRKLSTDRMDWEPNEASRASLDAVRADYRKWADEFARTHNNRRPRQRLSAWGLEKATPHK
jgi:hypothetical protein